MPWPRRAGRDAELALGEAVRQLAHDVAGAEQQAPRDRDASRRTAPASAAASSRRCSCASAQAATVMVPIVTSAPRQVLLSPNSRLPRNVRAAVDRHAAQPRQQVELHAPRGARGPERSPAARATAVAAAASSRVIATTAGASAMGSTVVSLITVTVDRGIDRLHVRQLRQVVEVERLVGLDVAA